MFYQITVFFLNKWLFITQLVILINCFHYKTTDSLKKKKRDTGSNVCKKRLFTFSILHYNGGILEESNEKVAGLQVGIQRQLWVVHHYTGTENMNKLSVNSKVFLFCNNIN